MMKDTVERIGKAYLVGLVSIRARKRVKCAVNNRILIVADGGMGDALVDGQALIELINYCDSKEKEIYLVCEMAAWRILRFVADIEKVHFIHHDFSGNAEGESGPKRVEKTRRALKGLEFDDVYIFYNGSLEAYLVAVDARAARRTTVLYDEQNNSFKRKIRNTFIWKHIENIQLVPTDCHHSERSRKLALAAGTPAYPIHILHIPKQKINAPQIDGRYITVAVDSTRYMRRWKSENFIELIRKLLEYFDYNVVITGNNLDENQIKQYDEAFKGCSRVKMMIGKQTLQEWIELIRGSQFHIGVDSGSIHVAAAVGTQSFCLTGKWDGEKFFPYRSEEHVEGTADPICIYRHDVPLDELECACCKSRGGYGMGNPECRKAYNEGKPCLCLDKITVDDVISVVDKALKNGDSVRNVP